MNTYSQHGEDLWIIENLKPPIGTFCEVGAYDGITSSNTLLFEELGWTGILIEPDPEMAWKCIQNRKAITWCCAVGSFNGPCVRFHINESDKGLSGIDVAPTGKWFPALVQPLSFFLDGFTNCLDFLSIDTEGTETAVWWGRGRHSPRIVMVEHFTIPGPSRIDEIVERFTQDGYHEVHRTPINVIFVRND
jgi:FkbM family methyltransferase